MYAFDQGLLLAGLGQAQLTLTIAILVALIGASVLIYLFMRNALAPLSSLSVAAQKIGSGELSTQVKVEGYQEVASLATALDGMRADLQATYSNLEQQVAERTRALEISTEVSRRLSTILDQDQLVREVVEQLRSAFGYYHAHIYLFDERKQNLLMVGGTGDAGRSMLAQGHKIEPGRGLVGRAAASNQVVLIPDVTQAEGWLPNPLLPDTRAEVAVPIALGEEVLGVLDVQHNITDGLDQQDADLIQSIANQVAIAVQNAQAYARTQHQAIREAQITAINQRIQSAMSIDDVLQVAISELGQVLEVQQASVELQAGSPSDNGRE